MTCREFVKLSGVVAVALGLQWEAFLGRTAARGLETKVFADAMRAYYDSLIPEIKAGNTQTFNGDKWEPTSWPASSRGFGYMEAPQGALGHWIVIQNGKIENYQLVVPTTWNGSPRDYKGLAGAYEMSLVGMLPLADPQKPLEILHIMHSFDPCMACAIL